MGSERGFLERISRNRDERRNKIPGLLRQAREALRLTQTEVAKALGWRQADISKMESGKRTPDVVELEDFALMCAKGLDYFSTWKRQLDEDAVNRSVIMATDEFTRRLEEVKRKSANRRFYRKRRVKMTSEQLAAVAEAHRRVLEAGSVRQVRKT